jgi:hypothetical protein
LHNLKTHAISKGWQNIKKEKNMKWIIPSHGSLVPTVPSIAFIQIAALKVKCT